MNQAIINSVVEIATNSALNGNPVEKITVSDFGFLITYKKKVNQDVVKIRCKILRLLAENKIGLGKALELQNMTDQALMYLEDDVLLLD